MTITAGRPQAVPARTQIAVVKTRHGILAKVTCPHCWHEFPPDQVLWVAEHAELMGDAVLGPEKPARFLPSRFTPARLALDPKGTPCRTLACPRCHLVLPRPVIENEPLFMSIIGGPASGKSYLLASMIWQVRRQFSTMFDLHFNDADMQANQFLNGYEDKLFLQDDRNSLVCLEKTEQQGSLYDQVSLGGQTVLLPKPFLFTLRPGPEHPNGNKTDLLGRVLCLYDNAGEHYQPGNDSVREPGTQHLGKSKVLMFLFDPTQDARFREQCQPFSDDPQLRDKAKSSRQETLLNEAAQRVRRYGNLPPNRKHAQPLMVLVSKSDVWGKLLEEDLVTEPVYRYKAPDGRSQGVFDIGRVDRVSTKLRALLLKWTPEVVTAAEDFCQHVVYIPVSALGCSPERMPNSGSNAGLGVRPQSINPSWVTVPLLYMLARWATGYVAVPKE